MPTTPVPGQDWKQLTLLSPEVLELTLKVGLVLSTEHAQFELEIRDPSSDSLVGLVSRPHVNFDGVDTALLAIFGELEEFVRTWTGPFSP